LFLDGYILEVAEGNIIFFGKFSVTRSACDIFFFDLVIVRLCNNPSLPPSMPFIDEYILEQLFREMISTPHQK
jgi:hypothetical protein